MAVLRRSTRENPTWLLWVIWGVTFAFIAYLVGSWFWFQRPIHFEERDVYGTWVNEGPHPTTLAFKHGGFVDVSGSPLPQAPYWKTERSVFGQARWTFDADGDPPSVSIGNTAWNQLYAENDWFSTSLVLFIGDPDDPRSRVSFTRISAP